MAETRVRDYKTAFDYNRDRDIAERDGWEMSAATEQPDGTLRVWYRHTGAPPETEPGGRPLRSAIVATAVLVVGLVLLGVVYTWLVGRLW